MEFQNMLENVYKKIEHRNELQDEQTIRTRCGDYGQEFMKV